MGGKFREYFEWSLEKFFVVLNFVSSGFDHGLRNVNLDMYVRMCVRGYVQSCRSSSLIKMERTLRFRVVRERLSSTNSAGASVLCRLRLLLRGK